jgi:hypothetical protein
LAEVEHLNDELEQILYGTDTGGKSWLDTIYQNITITQDCNNLNQLAKIFDTVVNEDEQIVMFINEKWQQYPTADTPNNTILWAIFYSNQYRSPTSQNLGGAGYAMRWRNGTQTTIAGYGSDYDAAIMAGDSFRKVVLR